MTIWYQGFNKSNIVEEYSISIDCRSDLAFWTEILQKANLKIKRIG